MREAKRAALEDQTSRQPSQREKIPAYFHLRALFSPLFSLIYLMTAPHPIWLIVPFLFVQFVIQRSEGRSPNETRDPTGEGSHFTAIPCALFALHFANLFLTARLLSQLGLWSIETLPSLFFLCLSSGLAGGSSSHELIHSRSRLLRGCGRLVLISIFHDHFFVEHLRGHHARVATREDPATARFGESLWAFLGRTLRDQLRSAWRFDRRAVLIGLLFQALFCALFFALFDVVGLVVLTVQAVTTVFFIQVSNYIEHWGLERTGRVQAVHAWDTANRNTLLGTLGFARHADHHLHPGRPFQALRFVEESPKLPYGYDAMMGLALFDNRRFQALLISELERRGLLRKP